MPGSNAWYIVWLITWRTNPVQQPNMSDVLINSRNTWAEENLSAILAVEPMMYGRFWKHVSGFFLWHHPVTSWIPLKKAMLMDAHGVLGLCWRLKCWFSIVFPPFWTAQPRFERLCCWDPSPSRRPKKGGDCWEFGHHETQLSTRADSAAKGALGWMFSWFLTDLQDVFPCFFN